jgi:uncharacterized protein (TIGR02594 family)
METPSWFEPFKAMIMKLMDAVFGSNTPPKAWVNVSEIPLFGDMSNDVLSLQIALNANGANLIEDRIFGPVTRNAVSAFQKANGLPGSGIIGPKTMELLGLRVGPALGADGIVNPPHIRDLVFATARAELGVKEIPGRQHNPRILEYHRTTGGFGDDETPWCASFVNWCLAQHGVPGTRSAAARSFLKWGKKTTAPKRGDIVVFWRVSPTSWQGHVSFFDRIEGSSVFVLGGNQSSAVTIAPYRRDTVLDFRTYP